MGDSVPARSLSVEDNGHAKFRVQGNARRIPQILSRNPKSVLLLPRLAIHGIEFSIPRRTASSHHSIRIKLEEETKIYSFSNFQIFYRISTWL